MEPSRTGNDEMKILHPVTGRGKGSTFSSFDELVYQDFWVGKKHADNFGSDEFGIINIVGRDAFLVRSSFLRACQCCASSCAVSMLESDGRASTELWVCFAN
jgi:hypothetical protein